MTEKKITRKVISIPIKSGSEIKITDTAKTEAVREEETEDAGKTRRVCFFDQSKTEPSYIDIVTLRRFMNDRAKIFSALKTHLCRKHQRAVSREIKYARHLALLPFTPKV